MGLSYSSSTSSSEQSANVYMAQQFSGTCNVTCQNILSGANVTVINSNVGGNISIDQTCSTDATCLINSTSDAVSDVLFSAANSSNAGNAQSMWPGSIGISISDANSRQDIRQTIIQSTNENSDVSSINQMNNISIFAANSTIGGGISITQNASTQGQCQLTNSMSAAGYASGMSSNTSKSGKDKKAQIGSAFAWLIGVIVVIIIVFIVSKLLSNHTYNIAESAAEQKALGARAMAGCPGGMKPMLDKLGAPIIDPKTHLPVCPPPKSFGLSKPEPINVYISEYGTPGGTPKIAATATKGKLKLE